MKKWAEEKKKRRGRGEDWGVRYDGVVGALPKAVSLVMCYYSLLTTYRVSLYRLIKSRITSSIMLKSSTYTAVRRCLFLSYKLSINF